MEASEGFNLCERKAQPNSPPSWKKSPGVCKVFVNLHRPLQLIISVLFIFLPSSSATIYVVSEISNETVLAINDMPARFVPERYAFYGMQGYVVYADPPTACSKVKPPPTPFSPSIEYPISWILLATRSPDCHFQTKIENAQISGYSAIIIHNVGSNDTEVMGVEDPGKLMIYATFIGEYDGLMLRNYTFPKTFFLRIRNDFSVNGYLLPFAVIVGICIIVMLLFMVRLLWQQVVRWYRERRRSRRRKLPASALKKLPVHKWTKGDPYETCAVCLDDFTEHEKIRILPCCHGYHIQCIDHWLTQGRRVCPICKRKVIVADEQISDSETETEDENAPLIPSTSTSQNPPSGASTFVQNQINTRMIAAVGQRRLLSRTRQTPAPGDSSDASSISSGASHLVTDELPTERGLTQSTVSDTQVQVQRFSRPVSSAGRFSQSHSQSVFAEVHQSTELLRKRLEAEYQKKKGHIFAPSSTSSANNGDVNEECVHQPDDTNYSPINESTTTSTISGQATSASVDCVNLNPSSVVDVCNFSEPNNEQLVVVIADSSNNGNENGDDEVDPQSNAHVEDKHSASV